MQRLTKVNHEAKRSFSAGNAHGVSASLATASSFFMFAGTLNLKNRRLLSTVFHGGDGEDRTLDLLNAIQALSQLSYAPMFEVRSNKEEVISNKWCYLLTTHELYHLKGRLSSVFLLSFSFVLKKSFGGGKITGENGFCYHWLRKFKAYLVVFFPPAVL